MGFRYGTVIVFLALLLLVFTTALTRNQVAIIANSDLDISTISAEKLRSIALGKIHKLEGGQYIEFVLQKSGSVHSTFLLTYIGLSPSRYHMYWNRQLFAGRKTPKSFSSDAEVISYVETTPGAIGYINSSSVEEAKRVKHLEVK